MEDHELVAMTQQYDQTHDGEYITHLAYEEINRQVMAGRAWAKCPNCGDPYPLDKAGALQGACSADCFEEYLIYLNAGWQ